jgi:hypothetical protein
MPETQTQAEMQPPAKPPRVATGFDDEIEDLGDRIAALTPAQARQLERYLDVLNQAGGS